VNDPDADTVTGTVVPGLVEVPSPGEVIVRLEAAASNPAENVAVTMVLSTGASQF
jgi:NADPH:quinone reductase-like Zn-dependent oxidoreductase